MREKDGLEFIEELLPEIFSSGFMRLLNKLINSSVSETSLRLARS